MKTKFKKIILLYPLSVIAVLIWIIQHPDTKGILSFLTDILIYSFYACLFSLGLILSFSVLMEGIQKRKNKPILVQITNLISYDELLIKIYQEVKGTITIDGLVTNINELSGSTVVMISFTDSKKRMYDYCAFNIYNVENAHRNWIGKTLSEHPVIIAYDRGKIIDAMLKDLK